MAWTTPHVFATFDVLGASQMNDIGNNLQFLKSGTANASSVVANAGPTSTTVELTITTLVATLDGSTKVEIAFSWYGLILSVPGDLFLIRLYDGITEIARWVNQPSSTTQVSGGYLRAILTPSAGSHTYGAHILRASGTGTGTVAAGATNPAVLSISQEN